jgi:FKBP-type peptidyl-prolyl cis-trans isomerase
MKRVLSVILLALTMVGCSSDSPETAVTPSGLHIEELVVGEGESARVGATAVVHYTGWLVDGTKFDSSVDRDSPFDFVIGEGRVIKGWDEGVATMRVGGKRKLTIPPDLAYGDRGAGDVIPPGATLVFEVELLEVR